MPSETRKRGAEAEVWRLEKERQGLLFELHQVCTSVEALDSDPNRMTRAFFGLNVTAKKPLRPAAPFVFLQQFRQNSEIRLDFTEFATNLLGQVFRRFDTESSGFIDAHLCAAICRAIGRGPQTSGLAQIVLGNDSKLIDQPTFIEFYQRYVLSGDPSQPSNSNSNNNNNNKNNNNNTNMIERTFVSSKIPSRVLMLPPQQWDTQHVGTRSCDTCETARLTTKSAGPPSQVTHFQDPIETMALQFLNDMLAFDLPNKDSSKDLLKVNISDLTLAFQLYQNTQGRVPYSALQLVLYELHFICPASELQVASAQLLSGKSSILQSFTAEELSTWMHLHGCKILIKWKRDTLLTSGNAKVSEIWRKIATWIYLHVQRTFVLHKRRTNWMLHAALSGPIATLHITEDMAQVARKGGRIGVAGLSFDLGNIQDVRPSVSEMIRLAIYAQTSEERDDSATRLMQAIVSDPKIDGYRNQNDETPGSPEGSGGESRRTELADSKVESMSCMYLDLQVNEKGRNEDVDMLAMLINVIIDDQLLDALRVIPGFVGARAKFTFAKTATGKRQRVVRILVVSTCTAPEWCALFGLPYLGTSPIDNLSVNANMMPDFGSLLSPDCEDCLDDVVVGEGTCSIEFHRDLLSNLLESLAKALTKEESKQQGAQPLDGPWWNRAWLPSKTSLLRRLIQAHRTVLSSSDASMHWSFLSLSDLFFGSTSDGSNVQLDQFVRWAFKVARQNTDTSPRQWLERLILQPGELWTSLKNASWYRSILTALKDKLKVIKRNKGGKGAKLEPEVKETDDTGSVKEENEASADVFRMLQAAVETYNAGRSLVHGISGIHFSCAENGAGFHMVATGLNFTADENVLPDLFYI